MEKYEPLAFETVEFAVRDVLTMSRYNDETPGYDLDDLLGELGGGES